LYIVDDFTRECVAIEVDTSITGSRVKAVLGRLAEMKSRLSGVFAFDSTAGLAKCG
jgi:hypothetical protein